MREFSTAQREAAGTDRAVGGFLAWARDGVADAVFRAGPVPPLQRIRAEQDNLAQALRHGLARADGDAVAATSAVLGGLWIVESVYPLLVSLTAETTRLLSPLRPGPASSRRPGRPWRCPPPTPSSSRGPGPCARWSP